MSDIPQARAILQLVLDTHVGLDRDTRRRIKLALSLMMREPMIGRAPAKRRKIDAHLRARIRQLKRTTKMTQHQIANFVGLGSAGRVSEVLHGKR